MTARVDCRSVFDLCLNDGAFGLREVNPDLKEAVTAANASDCMCGSLLWHVVVDKDALFVQSLMYFTQVWKIKVLKMTDGKASATRLERCQTGWCAQPADALLLTERSR